MTAAAPVPALPDRPRLVWLDTDPGLDDWLTWLLLMHLPAVQLAGVSVVAGNAPLASTLGNALRIRALHGWAVAVHAGSDRPLQAPLQTAQALLGAQGMRTQGPALPPSKDLPDSRDGVAALLAHLRRSRQATTLLAIGPLTNIAHAIQQDRPCLLRQVDEIVLMGGSTDSGNHTPAAEFNIHADPEAADIVFRSGLPIRMFGLNLCRQLLLQRAHVRALQALPGQRAQVLAGHVDAYQRLRSADGSAPMPLYDPVLALWLMAPGLFGFQAAPVDIELQGRHTRGMTVCDLRNRQARACPVQIAMQVDADAAMALFMQALLAALACSMPFGDVSIGQR